MLGSLCKPTLSNKSRFPLLCFAVKEEQTYKHPFAFIMPIRTLLKWINWFIFPTQPEAAVVSKPHKIKGESLYCFVTLHDGIKFDQDLIIDLRKLVRNRIGAFATPDIIQEAPGLPKTRSGKIMRRILRKVAMNDKKVGDTSTLADPSVVDLLFMKRPA